MATLKRTKDETAAILDRFKQEGEELLNRADGVESQGQYQQWSRARKRWREMTKEALLATYESDDAANEFQSAGRRVVAVVGAPWQQDLSSDVGATERAIDKLASLKDRLEWATEPTPSDSPPPALEALSPTGGVVFLVHGRNVGRREEVARVLNRTGEHEVVILDEQASRGRTLIEKFEEHAAQARYAVVLLTGDDVGGLQDAKQQQPRARQNVVFELGFFFGKLDRQNVAVLYETGVERPSDIDGLVYIEIDQRGNWRYELIKELRSAGLSFDANQL
jgi:hypothetical protein